MLENIKKENKIETDEQFQAALKQENLTLAELRKSIERNMIINQVQQDEVMGEDLGHRGRGAGATTTSTRTSSRRRRR